MATHKYFGRGKLLLSGEYAILDGALGLALPTQKGQEMTIKSTTKSDLHWKALDPDGEVWFESQIALIDFSSIKTTDEEKSKILQRLLKGAVRLNSEFLSKWNGFNVITQLQFPKDWGLGSSSTLTHLVAEWAGVHPLLLYFKVFNGSGYDVACAGADGPISYRLDGDDISYTPIEYNPAFKNKLHFVYLNKKQSSQAGIEYYLKNAKKKKEFVKSIHQVTEDIISNTSFSGFQGLIEKHESLVKQHMGLTPVKEELFGDFNGAIKSLGAWGGDFVLAASNDSKADVENYFKAKGFDQVYAFDEMIYSS